MDFLFILALLIVLSPMAVMVYLAFAGRNQIGPEYVRGRSRILRWATAGAAFVLVGFMLVTNETLPQQSKEAIWIMLMILTVINFGIALWPQRRP